jgi:hypothetical protein
LPWRSLIVTTVLLNVDWMWAMPAGTFFFSLRLPRAPCAMLALLYPALLALTAARR